MSGFSDFTALLVEPHSGMRASLHNMLNLCSIARIDHAVSSATAIRALRNKAYDMVLCEYDLGEGQDGQQLLEDLRHNKIIPLRTLFFMVTAERSYEKIVSAAELAPSDYILKPFTADLLLDRIHRAAEKRNAFRWVHHLMEQGDVRQAIEACQECEATHRPYATDFMRLRAELHVSLGEADQAEHLYQQLLSSKTVAWARLGLGKAFYMQQRFEEAGGVLSALVAENSQYMDAYDWLAKTHEAIGQLEAAKGVLNEAVLVSPHAVRRLRKLGRVALETGDVEIAQQSFHKVVQKAKYSEFRDPEDHVRLVQTLVRQGNTDQAAAVVRDLERSLRGLEKTPACRAISAAMVHTERGDQERAAEELNRALAACRETPGLSSDLKLELARNCLENQLEEGASEVMLDVMNNAGDGATMAKAMQIFEQAGRRDLAESVARQSRRQVVELVAGGAEKAKQGDYAGAVELMSAAVEKLPNNPQVAFNAAVAVLKYLEHLGWDSRRGEEARRFIESARRLDPANPRLATLTRLYQELLQKYGIVQGVPSHERGGEGLEQANRT